MNFIVTQLIFWFIDNYMAACLITKQEPKENLFFCKYRNMFGVKGLYSLVLSSLK